MQNVPQRSVFGHTAVYILLYRDPLQGAFMLFWNFSRPKELKVSFSY